MARLLVDVVTVAPCSPSSSGAPDAVLQLFTSCPLTTARDATSCTAPAAALLLLLLLLSPQLPPTTPPPLLRRCASASCERSNFGAGRRAPPMTHWTGTTVDFAYLHGDGWRVRGAYVEYSPLSDHLPVVVDLVPRT